MLITKYNQNESKTISSIYKFYLFKYIRSNCRKYNFNTIGKIPFVTKRFIKVDGKWETKTYGDLAPQQFAIREAEINAKKVKKDGEIYFSKQKISDLEGELPDIFFRTHRSYIVNINKIKEIIPWFNSTYNLKIEDMDIEVPVSRNKIKEFRSLLNIK